MADLDLDSFLGEIAERDNFLKTCAQEPLKDAAAYPPVRGAPPEPKAPKAKAKAPPKKAAAAKGPPQPKDEAAIWDTEEVTPADAEAPPVLEDVTPAGNAAASGAKSVKPRQRKHAYEYFNQWDAYDVDGELTKLEDAAPAPVVEEVEPEDEGLPPGLTATMLAKMPAVEIERRALNEKSKGNEFYKASEYKSALKCYTHSLRLQQNNAVVYANRGMCYLKLKQYRQALADTTAALQLDDTYTKAYLRRGIAHRRLFQHQQALKDLDVVLTREPHNKEALEHRRCAKIELEKYAQKEGGGSAKPTGGKQSLMIEEVDDDSDDEVDGEVLISSSKTSAPNTAEFERLRREQASAATPGVLSFGPLCPRSHAACHAARPPDALVRPTSGGQGRCRGGAGVQGGAARRRAAGPVRRPAGGAGLERTSLIAECDGRGRHVQPVC